jgi:hypothetical protein
MARVTEEARERQRAWMRQNKRDNTMRIGQIKVERGCVDCGYNAHPAALDFDHLPGVDKLHCVGAMTTYSWSNIEAEIAKCEVRCANCHRIKTRERLADGSSSLP